MEAVTRSVLEMLVRVLNWLTAHPDDEPGMVVLTTNLRTVMGRMAQVIDDQRKGQIDSRAASVRKQELRRAMLADPIAHLSRIGKLAGREVHELRSLFAFKPTADTQLAFQAMTPAGGSLPHNNMMPYLTLSYCIALQGVYPPRT